MGLLWFRRSKAKETEEVPPTVPAAPGPARVPLRLRGLLLLNLRPSDGPEHIEKAPPLGGRDEVIVALQALAPGITFDANGRAEYRKGLESILRDLPALAAKCDDGGRIENIQRSITVTLTMLNTVANALHDA